MSPAAPLRFAVRARGRGRARPAGGGRTHERSNHRDVSGGH